MIENSSLSLPLLTAENCPADFALVRNVADARAAYHNPKISNIFLLPQISADVQTGRRQLWARAARQLPDIHANLLALGDGVGRPNGFFRQTPKQRPATELLERDFAREDAAGALFVPMLPAVPKRKAVTDFLGEVTRDFIAITRPEDNPQLANAYTTDLQFSIPKQTLGMLHMDPVAVGLFNVFGRYATPVASWARMREAAASGTASFNQAARRHAVQQNEATGTYEIQPVASTVAMLPFMYQAPLDALTIVKPSALVAGKQPLPSAHREPWRAKGLPSAQDLRLLHRTYSAQ